MHRTPAEYNEADVALTEATTTKREGSLQLLIYIHHPVQSISINPDMPLVPGMETLSIMQASVNSIQNVTGLSVVGIGLLQVSDQYKARLNPGVIAGPVVGGAFLIVVTLFTILVIWIM